MFASPFAATPSFSGAALATAYASVSAQTGIESASAHRLISMLFDGYTESIARSRGAMRSGDIEVKGRQISKAARIIEEGLKASLDLQQGGRLAQDLHALYEYITLRLTLANVRNDEQILDECLRLIEPIASAWEEIRPQVEGIA